MSSSHISNILVAVVRRVSDINFGRFFINFGRFFISFGRFYIDLRMYCRYNSGIGSI